MLNLPSINGVTIKGSEDDEHFSLQTKLKQSEGVLLFGKEKAGDGFVERIGAHIDDETIRFNEVGAMFIDPQELFTAGDAIQITSEGKKPKINVKFDGLTVTLNDKGELQVWPDDKRALAVDDKGLHVTVDDKTIKYGDDGKLYAIPEPLKDGVATHIHYGTELWDSEAIDLVYDPQRGLEVDPTNHLYVKHNSEQAIEFSPDGKIQLKIVPEEGLDFKPDGKLFIKLVESEGVEFNNDGEIAVKLSEGDALEFNNDGQIKVKIDDSTVHINNDGELELRWSESEGVTISDGLIRGKVDHDTIHFDDATGAFELHLDEAKGIETSEGTIYIKIDDDTIHYSNDGKLELHLDGTKGIETNSEGKIYIKIDDDSIVINSEGKLESALRVNEALEMIDDGGHPLINVRYTDPIFVNSENKLELHLDYWKGTSVNSEGNLVVFPDRRNVIDKALMVNTEGDLVWAAAGKVDGIILFNQTHLPDYPRSKMVILPYANDSEFGVIKIDNKTLKTPVGVAKVNIDNNTIIYSDSEDKVKVNFDTVQKKLQPIDALEITSSEGWVKDNITVLYDALLDDSECEPSIDILRGNHLSAVDVLINGPRSAKGTLKTIVPAAAGTKRLSDPTKVNDLVDYNTLWDAISSSLGEFRGTFNSDSELERAWPYGTSGKNDYAYITTVTSEATYYDRYKCIDTPAGSEGNWRYEFRIANSTFTSPQWQAIMSTITEEDVQDLLAHIANTNNPHNVTASQLHLAPFENKDFDQKPTDGSLNAVYSNGIYDALMLRQWKLIPGNSVHLRDSETSEGYVTWISAETNLYNAGPGISISSEGIISSIAAVPGFGDIQGEPYDNPELAAIFDDIDTYKQDLMSAGPGIRIEGTTIVNAHAPGAGLSLDNNVFSINTPIVGGDGVNVEGTWGDSEIKINIINVGRSVLGDPTKLMPGQAISDYVESNFKPLQEPVNDVVASGSSTEFISSVTQDSEGKITVTKKAVDLSGLNVGNGTISISVGGSAAQTFTVNQNTNKTLTFPVSWNNLQDKPTIPVVPTVGNGQLTIANSDGSQTYGTFTANQTGNTVARIPTGTVIDIERW